MLRFVIVLLFCTATIGCGASNTQRVPPVPPPAAGEEVTRTADGHLVYGPHEVLHDASWPLSSVELDQAVRGYEWGSGHPLPLKLTRFVTCDDAEALDALRARYVGGGIIIACMHGDHIPHLFCLPEALDDLARREVRASEREYQLGEQFSEAAIEGLYKNMKARD